MITRIITFIGLTVLMVFITPILWLPLLIGYAIRWFAPELIVLGFVIDAYFGTVSDWPIYTLTAASIVLSTRIAWEFLRLPSKGTGL